MDGEFWFALMTKALQEQLARDDLRRRGFEVFWMYTSEWVGTGHKSKSRLVKRSWLSRYLFVHADPLRLSEVQDERARTMGVATVVHATNHEPYPIPDCVIDELKGFTDHLGEVYEGYVAKKANKFIGKPGTILQFKEHSPMFGLFGELIKAMDNGKLLVLFKKQLFGSEGREIEVNAEDVEVIVA